MLAEFVSRYEYQISIGFLIMAGLSGLGLIWIIVASLIVSMQKRRGRIIREYIDYFVEKQHEYKPKGLSVEEKANFEILGTKLKESLKPWVPLHLRRKAKS